MPLSPPRPPCRAPYPPRIRRDMTGRQLRAIRRALGLSLTKFAPELGIHWNTLARYERDEIPIAEPVTRPARLIAERVRDRGARASERLTARRADTLEPRGLHQKGPQPRVHPRGALPPA